MGLAKMPSEVRPPGLPVPRLLRPRSGSGQRRAGRVGPMQLRSQAAVQFLTAWAQSGAVHVVSRLMCNFKMVVWEYS